MKVSRKSIYGDTRSEGAYLTPQANASDRSPGEAFLMITRSHDREEHAVGST